MRLKHTVLEQIYEYTKDYEPIVATEVGQHQMWTVQAFNFEKPRKLLTSGGLGTMGFGFPAAMGACLADKGRLELVLIKVDSKSEVSDLLKIAEAFGVKVIDVSPKSYTLQAVCDERQLKSLIELLRPIGIKDIVRSGAVAIPLNG